MPRKRRRDTGGSAAATAAGKATAAPASASATAVAGTSCAEPGGPGREPAQPACGELPTLSLHGLAALLSAVSLGVLLHALLMLRDPDCKRLGAARQARRWVRALAPDPLAPFHAMGTGVPHHLLQHTRLRWGRRRCHRPRRSEPWRRPAGWVAAPVLTPFEALRALKATHDVTHPRTRTLPRRPITHPPATQPLRAMDNPARAHNNNLKTTAPGARGSREIHARTHTHHKHKLRCRLFELLPRTSSRTRQGSCTHMNETAPRALVPIPGLRDHAMHTGPRAIMLEPVDAVATHTSAGLCIVLPCAHAAPWHA